MTNKNIVNIKGKDYLTVAGRLELAQNDIKSIITELLPVTNAVVVKATVTTTKGVFTGISGANPSKLIEKLTPYEVAETSAVGRALGFAGYGVIDSIASADEMVKAKIEQTLSIDEKEEFDVCEKNEAHGKKIMGKFGKPYCRLCYLAKVNNEF